MAASVDVTSTTQQTQRQQSDAQQTLGAFRFGDINYGPASGSSGPGFSLTPLTTALLIVGGVVGIWLWKRRP